MHDPGSEEDESVVSSFANPFLMPITSHCAVALVSACSPGTAEDHERLDQLLADPIADYSPAAGDLDYSNEILGCRTLALGGDRDEHSSTVSHLWTITEPLNEVASVL